MGTGTDDEIAAWRLMNLSDSDVMHAHRRWALAMSHTALRAA